jgi:spore germination protein YaaH
MDDTIAAHLRGTALTTVALFSVTNTGKGAVNTRQPGYRAITGPIGEQVIRDAHARGVRVELVFTSFGLERNQGLFEDLALQDATIASLVGLVGKLGMDGIDVDVESLDPLLVPAYGAFVGRLREAVVAADAADRVTVATTANVVGAAMAAAAVGAGADRVFMMGYDYRVAGSEPGATSPIDRGDGGERDLPWSLDLYESMGVPVQRTLLGLPLYGVAWPVAWPAIDAPATGPGEVWIPEHNLALLEDPAAVPVRDAVESVEVYLVGSDGSFGPSSAAPPSPGLSAGTSSAPGSSPPPSAAPSAGPPGVSWQAVFIDSPGTLEPKLALANARGLAGAGFWAIGYERGLPGYTDLIARFAAGDRLDGGG